MEIYKIFVDKIQRSKLVESFKIRGPLGLIIITVKKSLIKILHCKKLLKPKDEVQEVHLNDDDLGVARLKKAWQV